MKEKLNAAQTELKSAKKDLVKFRKTNKLKADQTPEDEKLAKTMAKLQKAIEAKEAAVKEIKEEIKASKPARGFKTKYTYPTVVDEDSGEEREMTAAEKKKFRAKARAEAKKAEKGEEAPKKKEKKAGKIKEAPVKKKKKEVVSEEEDD